MAEFVGSVGRQLILHRKKRFVQFELANLIGT